MKKWWKDEEVVRSGEDRWKKMNAHYNLFNNDAVISINVNDFLFYEPCDQILICGRSSNWDNA